jgi:hypothetical protein
MVGFVLSPFFDDILLSTSLSADNIYYRSSISYNLYQERSGVTLIIVFVFTKAKQAASIRPAAIK